VINYRQKQQNFFKAIMNKDLEEKGSASRWLLDYACSLRRKILKLESEVEK